MRAAPPVVVELRCAAAGWRLVQTLLVVTAAAAFATMVLQHAGASPVWLGAGLAPTAAAAAAAGWHWASLDRGRLRWDGGRWWFQAAGHAEEWPGRLRATIDLGFWMLLRFDAEVLCGPPASRRAWLALGRAAAPQAAALRAAVYSRRLNTAPAPHRQEGEPE